MDTSSTLGPNSPSIALQRNDDDDKINLYLDQAHEYLAMKDWEAARNVLASAVALLRRCRRCGTDTPNWTSTISSIQGYELATTLSHLGTCCHEMADPQQAADYWQESLELKRKYYNFQATTSEGGKIEQRNTNMDLAVSLERAAQALLSTGDPHTAGRYFQEALEIKRLIYGKQQQHTFLYATEKLTNNHSIVHKNKLPSEIDQNAIGWEVDGDMKEQVYGYDRAQNTDVAHTLVQLGRVAQAENHFHKALNRYRKAYEMYQTVYHQIHENNRSGCDAKHLEDRYYWDMTNVLSHLCQINILLGHDHHANAYWKLIDESFQEHELNSKGNTVNGDSFMDNLPSSSLWMDIRKRLDDCRITTTHNATSPVDGHLDKNMMPCHSSSENCANRESYSTQTSGTEENSDTSSEKIGSLWKSSGVVIQRYGLYFGRCVAYLYAKSI